MTKRFPYISLHDAYPEHPKVAARSAEAFRAHVSAICYSHRRQTDGFVPSAVALAWGRKGLRELVQSGMLIEVEGGYHVRDYEQWNETKDEIEARRQANRIAGAKGADSRWHGDSDSTRHGEGHGEHVAPRGDVDVLGSGSAGSGSRAKPRDQVYPPEFVGFWHFYPLHVGKQAALRAWNQAVKRANPQAIIEGAERFREDPNRTDEFTPHPATWLNAGRWDDDPLPARGNGRVEAADAWLASKEAQHG